MIRTGSRAARLWWLTAVLLIPFWVFACGLKGPPVPPRQPPLPAVTGLKGQLDNGVVTLTWQHPADTQGVAGYVVYRAQTKLSEPDCPDCPLVFESLETLSVSEASEQIEFTQPVASGFRYTFKVRPSGPSGGQGPDSNLVVIEALPKSEP